jgi:hypothetical protein
MSHRPGYRAPPKSTPLIDAIGAVVAVANALVDAARWWSRRHG